MNAGKLALYADIPRPTVVRRLAELQRAGLVQRRACGAYGLGPLLSPPMSAAASQECTRAIQRAAVQLSRMDT